MEHHCTVLLGVDGNGSVIAARPFCMLVWHWVWSSDGYPIGFPGHSDVLHGLIEEVWLPKKCRWLAGEVTQTMVCF